MSTGKHVPGKLAEWIVRSLDGTITAEEFAQLDHIITTQASARWYYLEFMTTYVGLVDLSGILSNTMPEAGNEPNESAPDSPSSRPSVTSVESGPYGPLRFGSHLSDEEKKRRIEQYAHQQLEAFLRQEHPAPEASPVIRRPRAGRSVQDLTETVDRWIRFTVRIVKTTAALSMAAVVLFLIGLLIVSKQPVGMITASADAQWDVPINEQGLLYPRQLRLETGYAKIQMKKGSEVLIQAPSTIKLLTPNKLYLETGWLTAKVPKQARGFTVETPTSQILDYGTEFGVLVDSTSTAEVHVFAGKVGLASIRDAGNDRQQMLLKDEAATLSASGQLERYATQDRTRLFARNLPDVNSFGVPGTRLSLADIVGGGNGLGTGLPGQGLDPSTGRIMETSGVLNGLDGGYVPVPSLMFVDGVFVPDGGRGAPRISSTGDVFADCPDTVGICREAISCGAVFHPRPFMPQAGMLPGHLHERPAIGMPANAGITFDLKAIRLTMADIDIDCFRATCGLSDTVRDVKPPGNDPIRVTCWVLVDGRVRFTETFDSTQARAGEIEVALNANDGFLTLAATTESDDYTFAWAMFGKPALELAQP